MEIIRGLRRFVLGGGPDKVELCRVMTKRGYLEGYIAGEGRPLVFLHGFAIGPEYFKTMLRNI